MAEKLIKITVLVVIVAILVLSTLFIKGMNDNVQNGEPASSASMQPDANIQEETSTPQYTAYEPSLLKRDYERHVLFFHASWCPECRAYERAIQADGLPDNIQVLKVDYDSQTELKQKYGVTLQTTFVEVDSKGQQLRKWIGYGRDKSVEAILSGLDGN